MTRPPRCSSPLRTGEVYQHKASKDTKRVRLRLLDAEFCPISFNRAKVDKIGRLTSLRGRLDLSAPFVVRELSSEALRLPEASEGIMGRSGLVVMVEVMFIDTKMRDGCCQRRVRWAGWRRVSGPFPASCKFLAANAV
jgi:hypothetical protein